MEKIGNALRLFAGGVFTEKCAAAIMKGIEVKELESGHELGIELPKVTRIAFAAQVYVLTILVLILLNSQFTA